MLRTQLVALSAGAWLVVVFAAAAGCSLQTFSRENCSEDAECAAFGAGFVCGADGFCEPGEAGMTVALADTCQNQERVPLLQSSAEFVEASTEGLTDFFSSDIATCLGGAQPLGNDGFFAVDMNAGEKWHFHVRRNGSTENPAVYVVNSCDARSCSPGDGLDVCGDGKDEHMSFVAPTADRYFIGIDGRNAGGAAYQVLATAPQCGNGGTLEHSEGCDDGNLVSGDGCDDECRAELRPGQTAEVEPNDDFTAANVLLLEDDALQVTGQLAGRCDFDMYFLEVPADRGLRATMSGARAGDCASFRISREEVELELRGADGRRVVAEGAVPMGEDCPALEVQPSALGAGSYHLWVTAPEDEAPFDYNLNVELFEPPPTTT